MRSKSLKPLLWGIVFIMLVSFACNFSSREKTQEPSDQEKPTQEETVQEETSSGPAPVSNLQDAQGAVIQIEAVGTYVDPQYGEYKGAGRGTGFIIDPSGIAVTNNHVVTGAGMLNVWIGGDTSKSYNAKILGVSECSDLAVIDIEGEGYPFLSWYTDPVNVGLEIYTAGYPLGEPEYTLTKGIISKASANGETSWASVDSVLMHDATINPGNSGGPLITSNGKVVGVNYSSRPNADQYFAIKYDIAMPIIEKLTMEENVDSIGVNGTAVLSEDGSISGIWASSVKPGSPADQTGIMGGDIILSMGNLSLATDGTMADYCDIIRTHTTSDTIAMEVLRFSTNEILTGQINGTPLALSQAVDTSGNDGNDETNTGNNVGLSGYTNITDNTGALSIDVPPTWNEVNGELWEGDWGDIHFVAASVSASYDLDGFSSYYDVSGVNFSASNDWGDIGGYIQLLDGTKHWFEETCSFDGREDYDDGYYEGAIDYWICYDSTVAVIGARLIDDPLAFLVLVQVQVVTDDDVDAFGQILKTFDVVGPLP